jgi:hypothetical protein
VGRLEGAFLYKAIEGRAYTEADAAEAAAIGATAATGSASVPAAVDTVEGLPWGPAWCIGLRRRRSASTHGKPMHTRSSQGTRSIKPRHTRIS